MKRRHSFWHPVETSHFLRIRKPDTPRLRFAPIPSHAEITSDTPFPQYSVTSSLNSKHHFVGTYWRLVLMLGFNWESAYPNAKGPSPKLVFDQSIKMPVAND